MPVLELRNVSNGFAGAEVLQDVNLPVEEGEPGLGVGALDTSESKSRNRLGPR